MEVLSLGFLILDGFYAVPRSVALYRTERTISILPFAFSMLIELHQYPGAEESQPEE